jgi:hypothetical protein
MTAQTLTRGLLIGGGTALLALGVLTGCSPTTEKDAPPAMTTPTTASSAPAVSPTEKALSPNDGNSFSPSVNPTGPGAVCKEIVNGVCIR